MTEIKSDAEVTRREWVQPDVSELAVKNTEQFVGFGPMVAG